MKLDLLAFRIFSTGFVLANLLVISGCGWKNEAVVSKKPRPVEIAYFSRDRSDSVKRVITGSVSSWRTETVAMEVGGRLNFLAEENSIFEPEIDGVSKQINQLPSLVVKEATAMSPQLVARIDNEKYRILRDKAEISKLKTQASINVAKVELEQLLPAKLTAANAEAELAAGDYERAKGLFAQNAIPEAEFVRLRAADKSAKAAVIQAEASIAAQKASLESLANQLLEDEKNLEDAERNLKNCDLLFTSFRGELTRTEVEMGDLVQPNQPIGTVQMMDPIMIEFEVSAYDSRRLARMQRVEVLVNSGEGPPATIEDENKYAKIWEIDSVADPSSRTFTVTLLMLNQRTGTEENSTLEFPATVGRLPLDIPFLAGTKPDEMHAPEKCIFKDARGTYVLRIDNFKKQDPVPDDRILKVTPVYVEVSSTPILFYGETYFRAIRPLANGADEQALDRERDVITGPIQLPEETTLEQVDWSQSNEVMLKDNRQWMLRPGELVQVDISSSGETGDEFSIPIDAISPEESRYFVFLLDDDGKCVTKQEVQLVNPPGPEAKKETSSMMRIRALGNVDLKGRAYVSRGAHYLQDSEEVKVVNIGEQR